MLAGPAGIGVPRMYVRAIDALYLSGDSERAAVVAEEAYRRFAGHPDPATAAAVGHRAAFHRAIDAPAAGLPLIEEALRLYEQAPPSADHAQAWLDYADIFLQSAQGRQDGHLAALNRALEIAEAAGATALIPRILASLAADAFRRGQVEEGFAFLDRGWALAQAARWRGPVAAGRERKRRAAQARQVPARRRCRAARSWARPAGRPGSFVAAAVLAGNACEALLACGRTAEAAALIDPLTTGPPDRDHWLVHEARAEIDLLRGDIDAATGRRQLIDAILAHHRQRRLARESAQRAAELALWARRPGDALAEVQRVLPLFKTPDLAIFCGRLLAAGMRACADLAEQARARRDEPAAGPRWPRPTAWPPGWTGGRRAVHRPSVRGHDPGRAGHLGR